jgi:hypothetical protein
VHEAHDEAVAMGKYESLGQFLRKQRTHEIRLTFGQIEGIVKAKLPPSARKQRAWWSNNPDNSVMTKVWLDAGFRSEQVDMAARKLVFRRMSIPSGQQPPEEKPTSRPTERGRHPLRGALKGFVQIMPGTDLTAPADPDWGSG